MTFTGWLILVISWGLIAGLCTYCFWQILRTHNSPRAKKEGP